MNRDVQSVLAFRQALICRVLEQFREMKPEPEVRLLIYPCVHESLASARGFVMHGEPRPPLSWDDQASAPLADEDKESLSDLQPVKELRVGEYIHLALESERAGYLHLFNFGTSGDVAKLFPHKATSAREVPLSRRVFVTPNRDISRFMKGRGPFQELGDGQRNRLGRANGYPERLLALVMKRKVAVRASDLHPDWHVFDEHYRSAGGSGWDDDEAVAEESSEFSQKFPVHEWGWGYVEVPVVD